MPFYEWGPAMSRNNRHQDQDQGRRRVSPDPCLGNRIAAKRARFTSTTISYPEAAVSNRPHPAWEEVAVAAIVLAEGGSLTYQEPLDHRRGNLAGFRCPKGMVPPPHLPRNPSGKVLKRALCELDASGSLDAETG